MIVVLFLVLLPMVYVLSIGPVIWLNSSHTIEVTEDSYVGRFYSPLEYVANSSPAAGDGLLWYVRLWEVDTPPPTMPVMPYIPPAPATTPGAAPLPTPTTTPPPPTPPSY